MRPVEVERGHPSRRGEPPAPLAPGDPAVPGRAVVVDHHAGSPRCLAAGPADLGQAVGDRRGRDDVAGDDDQQPAQLADAGRPGVLRDHDLARLDVAAVRSPAASRRGRCCHHGVLVDPHAALERDPPQAAGQSAGCTVAAVRSSTPARSPASQTGARSARATTARTRRPSRSACSTVPPRHPLGLGARRPQPAAGAVVAVDPVRGSELAELGDGVGRLAGRPASRRLAGQLDQRRQLRPPREHEPAVAAARAAAADVRLEDDDVEVGGAPPSAAAPSTARRSRRRR